MLTVTSPVVETAEAAMKRLSSAPAPLPFCAYGRERRSQPAAMYQTYPRKTSLAGCSARAPAASSRSGRRSRFLTLENLEDAEMDG